MQALSLAKAISCFLLVILSSGVVLYAPQISGALGISVPLSSSGFGSQNIGVSRQFTLTNNDDNTVFAESNGINSFTTLQTVDCDMATQAEARVTKLVRDPDDQVINPNNLVFEVTVRQGDNLIRPTIQGDETREFCVDDGDSFIVTETGSQTGGFSFNTSPSGNCNIPSVAAGSTYQCTLTNTITGNGDQNEIVPSFEAPITPAADEGAAPAPAGTQGGVVGTTDVTAPTSMDPPFAPCEDETVDDVVIRAASSMKIIINGKVNLEKVQNALNELNTDHFHVAIINDIKDNDRILSSISNPPYTGKIIVEDPKGLKQKIIDYNILDVRRECSYITLAEAAGFATNANVAPLGEIGDPGRANLDPAQIDQLLIGGSILTTGTGDKPRSLNPPVATCNPGTADENNLAIYNIRGDIDRGSKALGQNDLLMYWTFDLIQTDSDRAKLVNNNNPIARVDLLTQEEKNKGIASYEQIAFDLTDLWTDCKQIPLTTESVFEPFINELNY